MNQSITLIILAITASCVFIGRVKTSQTCSLSKYCTAAGWCENFTSLAELNSLLPAVSSASDCQDLFNATIISTNHFDFYTPTVYLKANKYKGLVNDQLDLNRFLSAVFPVQAAESRVLNFCGFTGLDLNVGLESPMASVNASIGYLASSVDLFMNGVPIEMSTDGGRTCDETQLAAILNNTKMNFSVFSWTPRGLLFHNIKQPRGPLCPLAFKDVNIQILKVYGSPLTFFPSLSNSVMSGTVITNLELANMAIEKLDATIIHPQVFFSLRMFTMTDCTLRHIQLDVFKNKPSLQFITLVLYNMKGFVHGNGIEWMSYLSSNSSILNPDSFKGVTQSTCNQTCQNLLNNLVIVCFDEGHALTYAFYPVAFFPNLFYAFPDAEFCMFANFSFNQLIVATWNVQLVNNNSLSLLNCSCTLRWLLKNLALVMNFSDNPNVQQALYFFRTKKSKADPTMCDLNDSSKYTQAFDACDFPARLQVCAQIQTTLQETETSFTDKYFQLYDIQHFLSQASDFLSGGFNIGVSVFALATNLATLIVIVYARCHKKAKGPVIRKDDQLNSIDERFFTYMLANAFINCMHSLTFLLSTCIPCVPKPVSENLVNLTDCVITNMCVAGVMSVMKLMGNFTFLLMSMNRYLLVGK
jgi:hypothetical protein